MTADIGQALVRAAADLAGPLLAVTSADGMRRLFFAAGWVELGGIDLAALAAAVGEIAATVEDVVDEPPSDLAELGGLVARLAQPAITVGQAVAAAPGAPAEIAGDLADALLESWLSAYSPVIPVLTVLGVVDDVDLPALQSGGWRRRAVRRRRLNPDRLAAVIQDPGARLRALLADPGIVVAALWPLAIDVLASLGVGASTADTDPDAANAAALAGILVLDVITSHPPAQFTRVAVGVEDDPVAGLTVTVVLSPGLDLRATRGGWHAGITVPGPQHLVLSASGATLVDPDAAAGAPAAAPEVSISAGYASTAEPAARFGAAGGMNLTVASIAADLAVAAGPSELDVAGTLALRGLALGMAATDGFLSTLLGGGASVDADLVLAVSLRGGVSFEGSRAPRLLLAGKRTIGPVDVVDVAIEILLDGGVGAELTGGIVARIGPVTARVDRMGLQARLAAGTEPGAALPLQVGLRPPSGIGVLISAGPVTGGGYLFLDWDAGTYAGVVQLQFKAIALTAIGIVTTKLPGGQPGWSFLILVTVEFPGIPLGFGISLYAVGGLVGINRTMNLAAIQDAVRTGRLGSVLFPKDPVANAPQILADLAGFFPPQVDRFTIGVMARLGWGPGPLITVEAGIILEVPSPVRLVIAAKIRIILPTEEAALVRLRLDVAGTVDFGRGEIAIDGAIVDSRIGPFSLSGEMALRAAWGATPGFAMSAGGFHPRFPVPDGFPVLRRIAIGLADSENPRLRLETYLALTAATVQLGARLEVYVETEVLGHQVSAGGMLGFDALVHFRPRFGFEVDLYGAVTVSVDATPWLIASILLRLSGPAPWKAVGEARFRIAFLPEVAARVEATVGADDTSATATVSVGDRIVADLSRPEAFQVLPRADTPAGVVLRQPVEADRCVHPAGRVSVRQASVPLGPVISRFGGAVPADPGSYAIEVALGGVPVPAVDVLDSFSPGQFRADDPARTLSRPEYEPLVAGRALSSPDLVLAGTPTGLAAITDDRILGPVTGDPIARRTERAGTEPELGPCAGSAVAGWATARADRLRSGPGAPDRFHDPRPPARLGVVPERWTLADPATLTALPAPVRPLPGLPGPAVPPRFPLPPGPIGGPIGGPVVPIRPVRTVAPTPAVLADEQAVARAAGSAPVVVLPRYEVNA